MMKELNDKMTRLNRKSSGKVRPFGVPEHDNNGWIICESKSEGKRPYYFNVFTRCTTWQLPIPKGIDLPSYNFTQETMDDHETDEEMPLFFLSDSETEEEEEEEEENNDWKIDKDVLLKLYLNFGEEKSMEIDENLRCVDEENVVESEGEEEEMEKQSTGLSDYLELNYSDQDDDFGNREDSGMKEDEIDDEDMVENNDINKTIDDEELIQEIDEITDEKWAEFLKLTALKTIPYNDFIKRPVKKKRNIIKVTEGKIDSVVNSISEESATEAVENVFDEEKVPKQNLNDTELDENGSMNLQQKITPSKSPDSSKDLSGRSFSATPAYSMISAKSPVKNLPKKKTIISKKNKITKSKKQTKIRRVKKMVKFPLKMKKKLKKQKSPVKEVEEVNDEMMVNHLELSKKGSEEEVNEEMMDNHLELSEKDSKEEVSKKIMDNHLELSEKGSEEEVNEEMMDNHLELSEKDSNKEVSKKIMDNNSELSEKSSEKEVSQEMIDNHLELSEKGSEEEVNDGMMDLELSEKGSKEEVNNEMMDNNLESSEKGSDESGVKKLESCDSWSVESS